MPVLVVIEHWDGEPSEPSLQALTLARGYALLRTGYPDWLLLKAGDTWTKAFGAKWEKSGRSSTEISQAFTPP